MVVVVGAGSWGTTLANLLAEKNNLPVTLWVREPELLEIIKKERVNTHYLPMAKLSDNLQLTSDLCIVKQADVVVMAVPSSYMRSMAQKIAALGVQDKIFVSCAKGLEDGTFLRMSEILAQELPNNKVAALSGPNHAESVSAKDPTATVLACEDAAVADKLQEMFSNDYFRPYTNNDIIGVELAGSFKNIIALSSGVLIGLGYGDNTIAALMTRGLFEIARLGIAMGAQAHTFSGLAGVGDLMVTCMSKHSRNRRAGEALGSGKTLQEILAGTNMVVEGVRATQIAHQLAKKYEIQMPITDKLYELLYENKTAEQAIRELMQRDFKREEEFVEII